MDATCRHRAAIMACTMAQPKQRFSGLVRRAGSQLIYNCKRLVATVIAAEDCRSAREGSECVDGPTLAGEFAEVRRSLAEEGHTQAPVPKSTRPNALVEILKATGPALAG